MKKACSEAHLKRETRATHENELVELSLADRCSSIGRKQLILEEFTTLQVGDQLHYSTSTMQNLCDGTYKDCHNSSWPGFLFILATMEANIICDRNKATGAMCDNDLISIFSKGNGIVLQLHNPNMEIQVQFKSLLEA